MWAAGVQALTRSHTAGGVADISSNGLTHCATGDASSQRIHRVMITQRKECIHHLKHLLFPYNVYVLNPLFYFER